jgi:hypothetical protein
MLGVIVFTHRRPLQLHGYLQSLYACLEPTTVIAVVGSGDYRITEQAFPRVRWVPENEHGSFGHTLLYELEQLKTQYLLFGCDDVVWFRSPGVYWRALSFSDCLGFSCRLGKNIEGFRSRRWQWSDYPASSHWGYPLELTGTIYRLADLRPIVQAVGPEVRNPNHLEEQMTAHLPWHLPVMECPKQQCCISLMANTVQTETSDGTGAVRPEWSPEALHQKYEAGWRLNWMDARFETFDNVYETNYLPLRKIGD